MKLTHTSISLIHIHDHSLLKKEAKSITLTHTSISLIHIHHHSLLIDNIMMMLTPLFIIYFYYFYFIFYVFIFFVYS